MSMISTSPPETFSKLETARRLGISTDAVRLLVASGELRTITLPTYSRPRILRSTIDEMLTKIYGEQQKSAG